MDSPFLELLKNRINLRQIPFSERGSRLLLLRSNQHFYVQLAERWAKRSLGLSAYRTRPPLIDELYFTDADGNPLDFTVTTYPHRIDCQSPAGLFTITFLDSETLLIQLPAGRCGLTFQANLDRAQIDRRGGVLRLTGDIRRNVAYTTNAHILQNVTLPVGSDQQRVTVIMDSQDGQAFLLNITPRLGFNRYLPAQGEVLQQAAQRWHDWFAAAPPVANELQSQYYYAWWVMRSGLVSTRYYTTREAMLPSKVHYVGVWLWDAYFHALAYRHIDMHLAKDQLRILLDHQREDGMIPDAIHDEGTITHLTFPVEADVTKPPLIAWAAWKLYEADGDREFLDEIYEPIARWNNWWFEKNDLDGNGLCEYQHPFSSGLDDSPLWDQGMPVEAPDLNTYLCLQMQSLARMALAIGEQEQATTWARRAADLAQAMIRSSWDAQAGLFWARKNGQPIQVRTPFNLFPLLTGLMPPEINQKLVASLTDRRAFWPACPVPSVALDDPRYNPEQMWRGPTWVNINYLLIEGLMRCGYPGIARELGQRTLDMVRGREDIYEYYHPETGANPPKAAPIFGWSSAIFIDLAIQASKGSKK